MSVYIWICSSFVGVDIIFAFESSQNGVYIESNKCSSLFAKFK